LLAALSTPAPQRHGHGQYVLHCITVIGYDDSAKTYTYTDTCGKVCGGGKDGGLNTIDQHRLFSLVMNDSYIGSGNGGYIW